MKKRLLAGVLALVMCIVLLPAGAMASAPDAGTENTENWIDVADTNWYSEEATEYHISTGEQLAGLASLVNGGNTFAGKTIYLDNDIDLAGREWTSIGTGDNMSNYFGGTFDGKGYCIHNLTSTSYSDTWAGLFGVISQGTVQNLGVVNANIVEADRSTLAGILVEWVSGGSVINCYTTGRIEANYVPETQGDYYGKIVGGLVGQCIGGSKIIGCYSTADIVSGETGGGDTVGGLVGQWQNATSDALIADCWFGGSITGRHIYTAVGGILGANFDFYANDPGVTIQNCMVVTKEIRCVEPGNITWIAAVVNSTVENCLWPDSPPEDVTLDPEIYEGYNGTYLAVTKLVVDLSQGTASADPNFDQSTCGRAVSDFNSDEILAALNENASENVTWVQGAEHPVFDWDTENAYVSVTGVSLDSEELPLTVGGTAVLSATVSPDNATRKDVTWTSSDPSVARVDENGVVTAVGPGTATITATTTDGGKTASCTVTVTQPVTGVTLSAAELQLTVGGSDRLTATVEPENASHPELTWTSSDPSVARVDENGVVTAVGPGTAVITAAADGVSASCAVTVLLPPPIAIPNHGVTVPQPANGSVAVNPGAAQEGTLVTITPTPDAGYEVASVSVEDYRGVQVPVTENGDGSYSFTMPASQVTVRVEFAPAPEAEQPMPFTDVPEGAWYYDAVAYVYENDLMQGVSGTAFAPEETTTRGMLMTILARLNGVDTSAGDTWYQAGMEWAVAAGVSDGSRPEGEITREQVAAMLYRYAGSLAVEGDHLAGFADGDQVSSWARDAVNWAVSRGILQGDGVRLNPRGNATRAELAVMLMRFCQLGTQ